MLAPSFSRFRPLFRLDAAVQRTVIVVLALVVLALALGGCAAGDPQFTAERPAGFWLGLWHGIISWVTLIVGIFDQGVEVYERNNTGGWYDFGFLLGATSIWGGWVDGGVSPQPALAWKPARRGHGGVARASRRHRAQSIAKQ